MPTPEQCFIPFETTTTHIALPKRFTFPFYYQAHPLCELAAAQLQDHLQTQTDWQHDFGVDGTSQAATGKMFGVLVVENMQGELGYLSAFSGKIADQNLLPGFVPPVFDMLAQDSFFRDELAEITAINTQVSAAQKNHQITLLTSERDALNQQAEVELEALRQTMIESRAKRKQKRADAEQTLNEQALNELKAQLGKQSVAEKNQQKHLKHHWQGRIETVQQQLDALTQALSDLKSKRAALSNALQNKLFAQYRFLNIQGEEKSLLEIFKDTNTPTPPAGAGECAAPKLLHFAFKHALKPICMAEFWWGISPKSEVRKHKKYYPSCQSKCQPILGHMLEEIELDDNPLLKNPAEGKEIDILYQDEAIVVVNKPAEFLSVPGKTIQDSVYYRLQQQFKDAEGPLVIHRLDMSTSGILVFALTKRANKSLQKQFITRTVEKRYVALVEGKLDQDSGYITLPLRGDLDDRPRQMVCNQHGKPAETKWELIECKQGRSKVYLYPKTGRTHQLRVHCAHMLGLNMPIVGDDLYGTKADRLHLHAESLAFDHPYSKERMKFKVDAKF